MSDEMRISQAPKSSVTIEIYKDKWFKNWVNLLTKTKDPQTMEKSMSALLDYAMMGQGNAREVVGEIDNWLIKEKEKEWFSEEDLLRQVYVVETLRQIGEEAGKDLVIPALKAVAKEGFAIPAKTDAHNALYRWGVAGYNSPVD